MNELTKRELERYSRQIVFSKIGEAGQKKLKKAKVAILGLGGIGTAAALYLTCAGVGYIRLIDRDFVELNNIHRQVLFDEEDVENYKPKPIAAKEKLQRINSNITLEAATEDFNPTTAEELIKDMDIVLDGTDNMEARYLLNEVCVKHSKPFIHGAALGDVGVVTTIIPERTPCFKCIYPKIPKPGSLETCEIAGVVGSVPGTVGMIEAIEAIKYLVDFGDMLKSKILHFNLSSMDFDLIKVEKDPSCLVCSKRQFQILTKEIKQVLITTICGGNMIQITPREKLKLDLKGLASQLSKNPEFNIRKLTKYSLVLDYGKYSAVIMPSGRSLIKNVKSEREAKAVINKIISF